MTTHTRQATDATEAAHKAVEAALEAKQGNVTSALRLAQDARLLCGDGHAALYADRIAYDAIGGRNPDRNLGLFLYMVGDPLDRASSGSCQHYIETGRYLTHAEVAEFTGA